MIFIASFISNREMNSWARPESTEAQLQNGTPECVCCQAGLKAPSPDPPNHETFIASSIPQGSELLDGFCKH
jgi:hypothetical protein